MSRVFCEGDRTLLRIVELSDAPRVVEWKHDPLIRKMALSADLEVTLEHEREDIEHAITSENQLYLVIEVAATRQAIGYVRINWIDDPPRFAWLRFALGSHRQKGYAKDALRSLFSRLFTEGMHRVDAEVCEQNATSLGLLERLGFKREGVKRQAHFDGTAYSDYIALGLLPEDFVD